jgi:prophage regulatory protein
MSYTILRLSSVMAKIGLRRSSIYKLMSKGTFPKPILLGERAVGWLESDLDAWIQARLDERRPTIV